MRSNSKSNRNININIFNIKFFLINKEYIEQLIKEVI